MRLMCLLISVQSDVSDLGCRNKSLKSADHSETGAENRNYRKVSSCDDRCHALLNRSLNAYFLSRKIL